MKVLGIETSCDETAVCILDAGGSFGPDFRFDILGNALISQASLHAEFGGVFPNLAKREHARNLVPLLREALRQADTLSPPNPQDLGTLAKVQQILTREPDLSEAIAAFIQEHGKPDIDAIAVTVGPGLEPALWVGINFAKALSLLWDIPIVAVNHMEGHVVMPMIDLVGRSLRTFEYPVLALLISGGHTELVLSREFGTYEIVGETRDDAAGEAFDKVARLLDLPYPGGPEISRLAAEARERNIVADFKFTRPMMHDDTFDFSFSGLKTAVRKFVETQGTLSRERTMQIAREFEETVADVLVEKTMAAAEEYSAETIVVGGGVSANTYIRLRLAEALTGAGKVQLLSPAPELATDNAIMIALAGYFRALNLDFVSPDILKATGNLRL